MSVATPELMLRSVDDSWTYERWEGLPADSNRYEVSTKRGAYARAGLPEYWIVRPATRDVLVCSQPDAALGDFAQSRLVRPEAELVAETLPIRVHVAQLFAGAPDTTL
jgi:Uma2 family endonuclease